MQANDLVETKTVQLFSAQHPFQFECGAVLPQITVAYETYGELNAQRDNAVFVCHALTGSAHAGFYNSPDDKIPGWWQGYIGYGCPLDPRKYFIVCANLLSSCYGTSGPNSIDPQSGSMFKMNFPSTTTRDMVRVNKALLDYLGVKRLACVTGGSLGGMQVWEWIIQYPDFIEKAVPIAGTAQASAWLTALNEVARQAVFNDPNWLNGNYSDKPPINGLHLARMIGMISYRSQVQFSERFQRDRVNRSPEAYFDFNNWFQIESYLHYQGQKFVKRFDARSLVYLTEAMDLHDVSRGFESYAAALNQIQAKVLVIGISSDMLYFPGELKQNARDLRDVNKDVTYIEMQSKFGHDAFLIEYKKMNPLVQSFLEAK